MKYILLLITINFNLGCNSEEVYLDSFFKKLEKHSPKDQIYKFKSTSLDNLIDIDKEFDIIFSTSAKYVLTFPGEKEKFENYFNSNKISLNSPQVKLAIITAFHFHLNKKSYNFSSLLNQVIITSDSINRLNYPSRKSYKN